MIAAWFGAFVITCAVELVVLRQLARRPRWLGVGLAAQIATHPLAVMMMLTLPGPPLVKLALIELGVVAIEAAIYRRWLGLPGSEALGISLLANSGSVLIAAVLSS